MKIIVLFLLVALLSLKTSAQSLTCYSCGTGDPTDSFYKPCSNQISDSVVEQCTLLNRPEQGYTAICLVTIIFLEFHFLHLIKISLKTESFNNQIIMKHCAYKEFVGDICGLNFMGAKLDCCETNLCNGRDANSSPKSYSSKFLVISIGILIFIFL